jgi:GNAT superfamily N-acetyltransferase
MIREQRGVPMTDVEITVRPGRFDDVEREAALHCEVDWCYDEAQTLAEYHDDAYEPSSVIVAEVNGEVVGKLELFMAWKSTYGRFGLIRRFVVADGWRGRGVGRRLLEAAVARCQEENAAFLELTVDVTNPEAHAFYKREGFSEDRVEVIMRKPIGDEYRASAYAHGEP